MSRLLVLLAAAGLFCAGPALAGRPVTLKADTTDSDGVVTLGDIFENAGPAAAVPVATRTGASVLLNARILQAAAARAGLDWANGEGLGTIVVHGRASAAAATRAARANVDVLTYARSIAVGELIGPEDLVWGKAATAPSDAPHEPEQVIGLAARRPLRAGAAVAAHDLSAAQVIKAGQTVTISFEADGISLAVQGAALAAGGVGETIRIENTASKKVILAVVTGPGQAAVGPAADELKARSTRLALR